MDFNFTEEQTLLENMVTSFVRDNYPWEAREAIVKTEEGWKPENWTQFAELGLLGVTFAEDTWSSFSVGNLNKDLPTL